jgi:hypothetical protein
MQAAVGIEKESDSASVQPFFRGLKMIFSIQDEFQTQRISDGLQKAYGAMQTQHVRQGLPKVVSMYHFKVANSSLCNSARSNGLRVWQGVHTHCSGCQIATTNTLGWKSVLLSISLRW